MFMPVSAASTSLKRFQSDIADSKISSKAEVLFNEVMSELKAKRGDDLKFPREIMWLGGAPGAGKGTNTGFIMRERGYTAEPIVVSSLLQTPEMKAIKARGDLIGDKEVIALLLDEMLKPVYQTGVVVDGVPRTKVQADFIMKLNELMLSLHRTQPKVFPRPIFRMCVLYVEGDEAVRRQLFRGKQAAENNAKVLAEGKGTMQEERATDFDPVLARKRYTMFEEETYNALQELGKHFIYNFVNAQGSYADVENNIIKEMEYQSSTELQPETHDAIHSLPRSDEVVTHARQRLVERLNHALMDNPAQFANVVQTLEAEAYPLIERNAIAGKCVWAPSGTQLMSMGPESVQIILDVLSDRGFRANVQEAGGTVSFGIEWAGIQIRR